MSRVKKLLEALHEDRSEFYGVNIVPGIGGDVMGVYQGPDTKIKELHEVDFYDSFVDEFMIEYYKNHGTSFFDACSANSDSLLEWLKANAPELVEHFNIRGSFVRFGCNDVYEAGYIVFNGDGKEIPWDPTEYIAFTDYDHGSMGLGIDYKLESDFYKALPDECKGWFALMVDQ